MVCIAPLWPLLQGTCTRPNVLLCNLQGRESFLKYQCCWSLRLHVPSQHGVKLTKQRSGRSTSERQGREAIGPASLRRQLQIVEHFLKLKFSTPYRTEQESSHRMPQRVTRRTCQSFSSVAFLVRRASPSFLRANCCQPPRHACTAFLRTRHSIYGVRMRPIKWLSTRAKNCRIVNRKDYSFSFSGLGGSKK